jgi:hypothetical protein
MTINETSLKHWIEFFFGYGTWRSPVWFVAHEESGGELPEEVAERIEYFKEFHKNTTSPVLCELREMYKRLSFRYEGPKSHLYKNHFEQAELQLTRTPFPLPQMKLNPAVKDIFQFDYSDFELVNYQSHPGIKAAVAV